MNDCILNHRLLSSACPKCGRTPLPRIECPNCEGYCYYSDLDRHTGRRKIMCCPLCKGEGTVATEQQPQQPQQHYEPEDFG